MIRTSCAWARIGSRRTFFPRDATLSHATTPKSARIQTSPPRITRRYNASQPPVGQKAPETAQTIPGPSWLWLEPIYEPFRAYGRAQKRKPYMTQLVSSLVIYFVGDLVAQSIAQPTSAREQPVLVEGEVDEKGWVQQWSADRDWARTGRALVIGGLSSIPAYRWFLWLGSNFNYSSSILSLATKVVVNQAFFTPVFNTYFFGMQSFLSGATFPEVIERIKNTVPTSCINSCKLWPLVTAFSFTYVPAQHRSIFAGVIAIGWQTYLSLLNQRAAAMEEQEKEAQQETLVVSTAQQHGIGHKDEGRQCAV